MVQEKLSLTPSLLRQLRSTVINDERWSASLARLDEADPSSVSVHLAIFVEPFLEFILTGKKTIESRFSARRIAPYGCVKSGDILLLKRSSGGITGLCTIDSVWSYDLEPESWLQIRNDYSKALCAEDPEFWKDRQNAAYATLMRVGNVIKIPSVELKKRDRRGWVVLKRGQEQNGLI